MLHGQPAEGGRGLPCSMSEFIEDCEVYASSTYPVAISHGRRMLGKVDLKARVNTETGEVTFYVPVDKIDKLR